VTGFVVCECGRHGDYIYPGVRCVCGRIVKNADEQRRSYSGLSAKPAFLLMQDGAVVASVRADTALKARAIFKADGMVGDRVVRARDGA
jgi:hypothetical protein